MNLIKFFENNNLKYLNQTFVIGVSTGVDSMVLLDLFRKLDCNIVVAYCNHLKRIESDFEEEFITKYCSDNFIKLYKTQFTNYDKGNFQSEARKKRYQFFDTVIKKTNANYLVLAHHADDLVETIIQRILRGSSLKGFAGFKEVTNCSNYLLIRPLIYNTKNEIYDYAEKQNLTYFEDVSNSSLTYTRNRIRLNILKELKEENENYYKKFIEFSKTLQEATFEIEDKIKNVKENLIANNSFSKTKFLELSPYLQTELLFDFLSCYNLSKKNILELIKLIKSDKPNINICYKKNLYFKKEYDIISFSNENTIKINPKINVIIDEIKKYPINDNFSITVSKNFNNVVINLNNLWYNTSDFPFVVRNVLPGDKIKLKSGYKKISDLFIDIKLPKEKRENALVGCRGDEVMIIFGIKKAYINIKEGNKVLIDLALKNE